MKNMVSVDKEKLNAAIAKRGQKPSWISVEMGHASNYLSTSASKYGANHEHAAKYLELAYNIKREEYAPASVDTKAAQPVLEIKGGADMPELLTMSKTELHDLLYSAIMKALLDALD